MVSCTCMLSTSVRVRVYDTIIVYQQNTAISREKKAKRFISKKKRLR